MDYSKRAIKNLLETNLFSNCFQSPVVFIIVNTQVACTTRAQVENILRRKQSEAVLIILQFVQGCSTKDKPISQRLNILLEGMNARRKMLRYQARLLYSKRIVIYGNNRNKIDEERASQTCCNEE